MKNTRDSNKNPEYDVEVEPNVGGLIRVDTSGWPADTWHVWLEVTGYVAPDTAHAVLWPNAAREVARHRTEAADHADRRNISAPEGSETE
jgi:hypothetical protein